MSNLPAPIRHLILLVIAAGPTRLADVVGAPGTPVTVLPFVTAAITYALAWVTPLIQSYGVGSEGD